MNFDMFKSFWFLVFFYKRLSLVKSDWVATLPSNGCPPNFQRINNGCYMFNNLTALNMNYTWQEANQKCASSVADQNSTQVHLIAFESLAESIALSYWFQGYAYTEPFWTDLVYNSSVKNNRQWRWIGLSYVNYGYLKDSSLTTSSPYSSLEFNSSKLYELKTETINNQNTKKSFICEANVECQSADNKCMNGGTCYINGGRVLCACAPGYTGVLCQILIDNCDPLPCLHAGLCNNTVNNYTCQCTEFYNGPNCENEIAWKNEDARTIAWSACTGFVGFVVLVLCLMDLPWGFVFDRLFPSEKQVIVKKAAEQEKLEKAKMQAEEERKKIESQVNKKSNVREPIKAETLINSEEEILKRFRSVLAQTRRPLQPNANFVTSSPMSLHLNKRY